MLFYKPYSLATVQVNAVYNQNWTSSCSGDGLSRLWSGQCFSSPWMLQWHHPSPGTASSSCWAAWIQPSQLCPPDYHNLTLLKAPVTHCHPTLPHGFLSLLNGQQAGLAPLCSIWGAEGRTCLWKMAQQFRPRMTSSETKVSLWQSVPSACEAEAGSPDTRGWGPVPCYWRRERFL